MAQKAVKAVTTIGGALLVAGTSIGAGMLGLPVVTGPGGFGPSLVVLLTCWALMTATGLLYAELCLWLREDANIPTLAEKTLGKWGKAFAWGVYLFLFYALLVAYLVGGGNLLHDIIDSSNTVTILLFGGCFIAIVAMGRGVVDRLNRLFMVGLFVAYFGFVLIGASATKSSLLLHQNWSQAWFALPVAFTAFAYQGLIPTLAAWMHYERPRLYRAILFGTLITLLVYGVWVWLILGIVPVDGEHGLQATLAEGRDAIHPLQFFTNHSLVSTMGRIFAFFAIATSFLGVGIGMVGFWADGLNIKAQNIRSKFLLLVLTFLPPLIIAIVYPHIFLEALGTAGGFGSALLLGALPILMAFSALRKNVLLQRTILGKKWLLAVLLGCVVFEIFCEIIHLFGVGL